MLNYYHRCCILLLNYFRRCCIAELLPQVYCWTITTCVVLLNYYHRCCIVLLNYYHRCCIVLLNYCHRCCIVLLNYYHRCRDVAGAALSSFSGPPPPSRTGLPPLTLLVTVSQSINQSINRFCLSIHSYIHVSLRLSHICWLSCWNITMDVVLYSRTITTYVYCIVDLLRLMLCCWTITIGSSVLWPVAAHVVLLNTCQMRCNVLLNLFHKCYHSCCIVLLSYYHRCCIVELLPFIFGYDCFYSIFWTNNSFENKPNFMVDYHRPRCPIKIFDSCV